MRQSHNTVKMKKKILFISFGLDNNNTGGNIVSNTHFKILKILFCDQLDVVALNRTKMDRDIYQFIPTKNKLHTYINSLLLYNNLNLFIERNILKIVKTNKYEYVFLDSSVLGRLAPEIKKKYPKIKIITFLHNIEKIYYKNVVNLNGFLHLPFYFTAWFNEYLAVKYSDRLFVLNDRDNDLLFQIYGKKADIIIPVVLEDKFKDRITKKIKKLTLLFVGSYVPANVEGISWFIKNVIPSIDAILLIIGKDMEKLPEKINIPPNVQIIGTVSDLSDFYYSSDYVVIPLFSGSGQKVKTAEALMHGKSIIGTDEAFVGYNIDYDKVGALCNTKDEFIEAINKFSGNKNNKIFNPYSRKTFLNNHSFKSAFSKYKNIFQ
jgi:polysaccharide biosynthesis protein PslH